MDCANLKERHLLDHAQSWRHHPPLPHLQNSVGGLEGAADPVAELAEQLHYGPNQQQYPSDTLPILNIIKHNLSLIQDTAASKSEITSGSVQAGKTTFPICAHHFSVAIVAAHSHPAGHKPAQLPRKTVCPLPQERCCLAVHSIAPGCLVL